MIGPVNKYVRRVRHVSIGRDRTVVIDTTPSAAFRVRFGDVTGGYTEAGSPRDILPQTRMSAYSSGIDPSVRMLVPGDWIEELDTGQVWEMLEFVKNEKVGFNNYTHVLSGIRFEEVYPFDADLTQQDGTVVVPSMPCALWEQSETSTDHGRVEQLMGDCPLEYFPSADQPNMQLRVGGRVYRIVSALQNRAQPNFTSAPHVSMRLRRAQ